MATQLFFRAGTGTANLATTHRGTNTARLAGGTAGWEPRPLALTRGPSLVGYVGDTVTGPTAGIEVMGSTASVPVEWLSDPVAADVTISGTITANLWGNETSMSANVAINVVIDILRSNGSIQNIVTSTFTTELPLSTSAAHNFTTGMTSGAYTARTANRGDRIRIRVFGDDSAAATMATAFQFTFHCNGPTAAASGDSYVTFTENITFESAPGAEAASITQNVSSSTASIGGPEAASEGGAAQSFLAPSIGSITRVELRLQKVGTPTDNINVEIRTDSGTGIPTSTVLASASMAASGISGTNAYYSFSVPVSLTSGVTYWIVVTRSGAVNASNYILWLHEPGAGPYSDGLALTANAGGSWSPAITGDFRFIIYAPTVAGSVIYLTDTASAVTSTATALDIAGVGAAQNLFGGSGTAEALAQSFTLSFPATLYSVTLTLSKANSPTDNITVALQADAAGVPSGTNIASASMACASLTASAVDYTFLLSASLSASTQYWVVLTRDGARDTTNVPRWFKATATYSGGSTFARGSGSWVDQSSDSRLTLTALSPNREAWTSRGGGVVNDVTNTAAGFTSPIQVTDTAGGMAVDWFTKQLQAVTLTGLAQANIRALESAIAANASILVEIARVNSDGTSPTVWAAWNMSADNARAGELNTSESAETVNVSGDDLAITDGQRLRIRLYIDDMPTTAMGASQTVTTYYNGTSGGASGDSYITFPVTLAEFVSASPGPASSRRQRRASRYLTFR